MSSVIGDIGVCRSDGGPARLVGSEDRHPNGRNGTMSTSISTALTGARSSAALRPVHDVVLLVARVGLGVLMIGHAWLMFAFGGYSLGGVGALFAQLGVPFPTLAGLANVLLESVGGVAMIVGLAVPVVGVLMALNMIGAWVLVHTSGLYAMDHNGPETVITIGLLGLVLAVTGSGRFGLDHLVLQRRRPRAGA
jgi:putative oxidoreductase